MSWTSLAQLMEAGQGLLESRGSPSYGHWYEEIIPICRDRAEFFSPSAFGFANNLYQLADQQYGALFVLSLLLLNRHETRQTGSEIKGDTEIRPNELIGLWAGKRVVMAHREDRVPYGPGHRNHYQWAKEAYTDITPAALAVLHDDKYLGWLPRPPAYRKLLDRVRPADNDLRWLTPELIERLYRVGRARTFHFLDRMRSWILRQRLTDETRRHLGGRPGRLRENKRKERVHRLIRPRKDTEADQGP